MNRIHISTIAFALLMGSFVSIMSAQVVQSRLTDSYAVGDTLERQVYLDKKAPAVVGSWSGAFQSSPNELPSPIVDRKSVV